VRCTVDLAVKSGVGHRQNVAFVEKLEERANELAGQEVGGAGCRETPRERARCGADRAERT